MEPASAMATFGNDVNWDSSVVRDMETGAILGRLIEINSTKLLLESDTPLPAGHYYRCCLHLSTPVAGHTEVYFQARSLSTALDQEGGHRNTLGNISAAPGDIDAIEMLILHMALKNF